MTEANVNTLILVVGCVLAVVIVVIVLRATIKKGGFKIGRVSGTVETHRDDSPVSIKNVEQVAASGGNNAKIHSSDVTIDGFVQSAAKDNILEIGKK